MYTITITGIDGNGDSASLHREVWEQNVLQVWTSAVEQAAPYINVFKTLFRHFCS